MELQYNFLNILVMFGAIQGFLLCLLLYRKRSSNKQAAFFFILFLFSLAFYNLMYSLLSMDFFKYYRPLHVFPYPFKWLIGVGFYFYVRHHFKQASKFSYHLSEWYLFLPAVVYLILRTYWFIVSSIENSYRIIQVVVDSNFFRIQEFLILIFNTYLLFKLLTFLKVEKKESAMSHKKPRIVKAFKWLMVFTILYLILTLANLIAYSVDMVIHGGKESFAFIYPTLILNVIFIYWIGFMGFTKPNLFFNVIEQGNNRHVPSKNEISIKLESIMTDQGLYKKPGLTLNQLSNKLNMSPKELSTFINEKYQMNFSEYINQYRVEDIKKLLKSPEAKIYTLVSLSELAGFRSKSTFNATFKKMTGMTPSEYKKKHETGE